VIDKIVVFIVIHNSDTIVLGDKTGILQRLMVVIINSYAVIWLFAIFNSMGSAWKFVISHWSWLHLRML